MMRIPAVIGLMSATLVFLSTTGEQQSERLRERVKVATAGQATASKKADAMLSERVRQFLAAVEERRVTRFIQDRNDEIAASIAGVEHERELARFAEARNAEIEASLAAVDRVRTEEFAEARNKEIAASLAAVEEERQLRTFAEARNAEIELSIAAVEHDRLYDFAADRNREIAASVAAVESQRELTTFAEARNAEIAGSIAAVEDVRMAAFTDARNTEIRTAMRAHDLRQAGALAMARATKAIETGSIEGKSSLEAKGLLPQAAATPGGRACQSMLSELGPIYWTRTNAALSDRTKRQLDALAAIAERCASMVIEVHGHSDARSTPEADKWLTQQRAQAVAAYLIAAGVEEKRIVAIGHGAEAPIVSGDAEETMACNRRIEFSMQQAHDAPKLSEVLESLR